MIVLIPVDAEGEDGVPLQLDQPRVRVGHGSHNDMVLDQDDTGASYEHAMISVVRDRAIVVCDPTAKPTYIDGVDVTSAPEEERQLRPGDIISFGKGRSIFRVHRIGDALEAHAPSPHRNQAPSRVTAPSPPQHERQEGAPFTLTFQVFKDGQATREEAFDQPLVRIGRMRSSHLLLDDESVSRTHAVVEISGEGEVLLMDLDSSSGTAVNGVRVKKALLKSGDRLEFGKARATVRYGKVQSKPAAVPPPIPPDAGLGRASTQVLSPGEWETIDTPRLVVRRNGVEQGDFALTSPRTTIGRLPANDIQLDDGAVSGKHAVLVAKAGVFLIIDQQSTNGTYLNGNRCSGEALHDGDVVQIGRYELHFVASAPVAQRSQGTEILSPEAARALFAKSDAPRGGKT